jgi:hypothetical protein
MPQQQEGTYLVRRRAPASAGHAFEAQKGRRVVRLPNVSHHNTRLSVPLSRCTTSGHANFQHSSLHIQTVVGKAGRPRQPDSELAIA